MCQLLVTASIFGAVIDEVVEAEAETASRLSIGRRGALAYGGQALPGMGMTVASGVIWPV